MCIEQYYMYSMCSYNTELWVPSHKIWSPLKRSSTHSSNTTGAILHPLLVRAVLLYCTYFLRVMNLPTKDLGFSPSYCMAVTFLYITIHVIHNYICCYANGDQIFWGTTYYVTVQSTVFLYCKSYISVDLLHVCYKI